MVMPIAITTMGAKQAFVPAKAGTSGRAAQDPGMPRDERVRTVLMPSDRAAAVSKHEGRASPTDPSLRCVLCGR